MEIVAVSGNTVAQVDEDELRCMVESGKTGLDLKRLLSARVGCSRFQQRLFIDQVGELEDDMPLTQMPNVQLIIMPLCIPDETTKEELLQSCQENRVAHLEQLLQKPHDPNGIGLSIAAQNGHLEVVQLLLEAGADKDAATANGRPVLLMAAAYGHLEVVRLLLEAGADKDAANANGATALYIAAQNGHLEVVRLLLEAGANTNAVGTDELMFIAAENGHLEVVRLLLEAGADKDAAMANGATAVFIAVENGHLEVVRLLLEAGADKNTARTDGLTPLLMAAQNGHLEVVQLLREVRDDR